MPHPDLHLQSFNQTQRGISICSRANFRNSEMKDLQVISATESQKDPITAKKSCSIQQGYSNEEKTVYFSLCLRQPRIHNSRNLRRRLDPTELSDSQALDSHYIRNSAYLILENTICSRSLDSSHFAIACLR